MPTIETERLVLRAFTQADLEPYFDMCSDPEVVKYLGDGTTLSRTDAWRHLAIFLGTWQLRGYGMWAAEEKTTGRFVGRVGYLHPAGWPGIELAWALARQFWGLGLASEASRACLNYGFTACKFDHVISLIQPQNSRSIAVAERLGARHESSTEVFGKAHLTYGIRRNAE
ncbi:MAG: GNAT family N-acetyltransferase [Opitutaceae bacterium]